MTKIREHATFEELNDLVDGRLDRSTAARLEEHLAVCAECRSEHAMLAQLVSVASSAPQAVDPDDDLWGGIKSVIDSRKEVALPIHPSAPTRSFGRQKAWQRPWFLAAAAVVLIALSSGITAVVLRAPGSTQEIVVNAQQEQVPPQAVLPASFQATEAEYGRTIRELQIAVDAQRSTLNPRTVRTVEHSLAVVDTAIAEARAALVADPNNRTLVDLLASSYQRKLDLLRRTSELSSKI